MTAEDATGDGDDVLNLQQLVRARMDERGWGYADLARRSGDRLTRGRWQQIGTGVRLTKFPDPLSLQAMADALEVDVTTVILAAARTLGLDAHRRASDFAQLLPNGTDRLSQPMQDALLTIIRAAVLESLAAAEPSSESPVPSDWSGRYPRVTPVSRGNGRAGANDSSA